jgi:hypothetical protein
VFVGGGQKEGEDLPPLLTVGVVALEIAGELFEAGLIRSGLFRNGVRVGLPPGNGAQRLGNLGPHLLPLRGELVPRVKAAEQPPLVGIFLLVLHELKVGIAAA